MWAPVGHCSSPTSDTCHLCFLFHLRFCVQLASYHSNHRKPFIKKQPHWKEIVRSNVETVNFLVLVICLVSGGCWVFSTFSSKNETILQGCESFPCDPGRLGAWFGKCGPRAPYVDCISSCWRKWGEPEVGTGAKNGERKIAGTNPYLNFVRTHPQIMLNL